MSVVPVLIDPRLFRKAGRAQQERLRWWTAQLEQDPYLGNRIPRHLVPARFRSLPNLYRLPLPSRWRTLYAVAAEPTGRREVRFVWIGNHDQYLRLFGY